MNMSPESDRSKISRRGLLAKIGKFGAMVGIGATVSSAPTASEAQSESIAKRLTKFDSSGPEIAAALKSGMPENIMNALAAVPSFAGPESLADSDRKKIYGALKIPTMHDPDFSKFPTVPLSAAGMRITGTRFSGKLLAPGVDLKRTPTGAEKGQLMPQDSGVDLAYIPYTPGNTYQKVPEVSRNILYKHNSDGAFVNLIGYTADANGKFTPSVRAGIAFPLAKYAALKQLVYKNIVQSKALEISPEQRASIADPEDVKSTDALHAGERKKLSQRLEKLYFVPLDVLPNEQTIASMNEKDLTSIRAGATVISPQSGRPTDGGVMSWFGQVHEVVEITDEKDPLAKKGRKIRGYLVYGPETMAAVLQYSER